MISNQISKKKWTESYLKILCKFSITSVTGLLEERRWTIALGLLSVKVLEGRTELLESDSEPLVFVARFAGQDLIQHEHENLNQFMSN